MRTPRHDRRSQRTHRLLAGALVALLYERRYSELTVQDILDRANVGRTTFYSHFYDKDDLLASEMERVIEVLWRHVSGHTTEQGLGVPSLALFRHLQEQYGLYRALVRSEAIDLIWATMKRCLTAQVEHQVLRVQKKPIPDVAVRLTAQVVAGTLVILLEWWLAQEMPLSPEQMDAYFHQLLRPGVLALLRINE